ncbi:MAG: amidohydrolase family protein [Pseudomonadota bacterium]
MKDVEGCDLRLGLSEFSLSDEEFEEKIGRPQTKEEKENRKRAREAAELDALETMDKGMRELYALCDELEIPILTHSSSSRGARPECMEPATLRYPELVQNGEWDAPQHQWTNSTHHWAQALKREQRDGNENLKVVLAHFAGGFAEMEPYREDRESLDHFSGASGQELVPSPWLSRAMNHIENSRHSDLYIDLSIMTELAYSQSKLEPESWRFSDGFRRSTTFRQLETDNGQYARKFTDFMLKNKHLHDRVMYGSDWHMPSLVQVSGQDAYMQLIERTMPTIPICRKVMGENAARFFGLHKNDKNRDRIERFLWDTARISAEDVVWMQKVDRIADHT